MSIHSKEISQYESFSYIIIFMIIELFSMFLLEKYCLPSVVKKEKVSTFLRDTLCIPISIILFVLSYKAYNELVVSKYSRWFGTTNESYCLLYLYLSHNIIQV